ncbi:MFS transporter [Deinococcus peraridilitoris]|uniref:Fucose permease n=1 Tax=Deinococcus peraridilitoris (strain DSM 19664 / LMG 22246 / CIP 109416 / KR-200) TaxID=937777 RepID=L0A6H3_DEIPD|nr:MFS transporter [Deinococcus peraridilitoris]AFZ69451.1 fucose permease [Deinococcus peraridilitoris DSM 19664]
MPADVTHKVVPASAAVIGALAFVLMGGVQALYGPSLPGFSQHFGLPVSTVGLVISAHGLGALAGVLGTIPLTAHPAGRYRTGAAVVLLAVGALTLALTTVWPVALLGALTVGMGYGVLTVGLNSLFAVSFGQRSAAMVNLLNAVFGMGAILGPLLVGRAGGNVSGPFFIVALGAGLLAPFAFSLDDRLPVPAARQEASIDQGRSLLVGFLVLLALGVGLEASSSGWNATYLVALGHTPATAASFTSLFYLAFTAARLAAVPLSLRLSSSTLVTASLTLAAVLLLLAQMPALAPYMLAMLGGSVALLFPNTFTWLARTLPAARGGTALMVAGALLGGALFPALIGQAVAAFGERVLPNAMLALTVLALILAVWLLRMSRDLRRRR